jgi:hypothetical protein
MTPKGIGICFRAPRPTFLLHAVNSARKVNGRSHLMFTWRRAVT